MEQNNKPSFVRKSLGAIFNKRRLLQAVPILICADLFLAEGDYGEAALNSAEFTRPAAAWYAGAGFIANYAYREGRDLVREINGIAQEAYRP